MIGLISLNFKNAPLDLREKFYLDNADKIVFHNLLKKNVGVEGLMLLSTCNRTEIYFEFENHIGKENKFIHSIVKELADFRKFKDSISPHLMMVSGSYKVSKHLFRLVSGLESMIIGEFQIVEQLKDAYDFSYKHKMLGPILKRMFQKSLETGKFIRTNTKIGKGAVSVSYAAVEKIHKDLNISNPKFLCVGLGETSQFGLVSPVVGFDFYHYKSNFWLHLYGTAYLPYHKYVRGDKDEQGRVPLSYLFRDSWDQYGLADAAEGDQWWDYQAGANFGWKINKSLGVFADTEYTKMWDSEMFITSFGLNYTFR